MENLTPNNAPTFESVWAALQESNRYLTEKFTETREQFKETDRLFKETDRKFEKYQEDYERRMKNMEKRVGAWDHNHGSFAEEYFFNSFEKGQQNFFGETFDEIRRHVNPKERNLEDEYDIVLYNGTSVAIIEVKYKAHENDVFRVLKKAETFKILCSSYKDFKLYLGLASMAFYPALEQKCMDEGIAIIKQVGDKVIINDEHLKVF